MKNDTTLAVRVLTLPGAADRQDRMHIMLDNAQGLNQVPWEFHHAIPFEASTLSYDDGSAYADGRTLSPAELSCFASHFDIISSWLENGTSDILLVLEDDVYLDPWFDFRVAASFANSVGLDYLRLYARVWMPARQIVYRARSQLIRFTWSPGGMQAFMLTRKGARRIVDAVARQGHVTRPIDDLIDRYWEVGNPIYALFPSPVLEHCMPTMIHVSEQVRARQQRQAQMEDAARSQGTGQKLEAKIGKMRDRLARRKVEQTMKRSESEVAARALAFMSDPAFAHFKLRAPDGLPA